MEMIHKDDKGLMAKFYEVLCTVQNLAASATADTGKYKYNFVPLDELIAEVKRALLAQEFALCQEISMDGELFTVTTTLIHSSGDILQFEPAAIHAPKDPQAMGSCSTYLRRYSLMSLFGLAPEDDDGAAASAPRDEPRPQGRQQPPGQAMQSQAPGRTYRTPAEATIRAILAGKDTTEVRSIQAAFKEEFSSSLTDLPRERHDEALRFVRWLISPEHQPGDTYGAPNQAAAEHAQPHEGVEA